MSSISHATEASASKNANAATFAKNRPLVDAAGEMNRVLTLHGLSARLSVAHQSVVVGNPSAAIREPVEFAFASRPAFDRLMKNVRLYDFAKAYFDQQLDIVGSFDEAAEILYAINVTSDRPQSFIEKIQSLYFRATKAVVPFIAHRFESDAHYSMSADAYRLFLDEHLQYTCGKFLSNGDSLDQSQTNKFSLIENLSKPLIGELIGKSHLDIGCGWGGLVSYFGREFKTQSRGITNSESQRQYAKNHFRINVLKGDYSDLQSSPERYDLITIIGMAEHLTPRRRSSLFRIVHRLLKADGIVYFQCIAKPNVWIGGDAYRIAYEDVFPGHYLETRSEMELRFRRLGFNIVTASDDASDYARTTALWAANLEANKEKVVEIVKEANFRILFGYLMYASKLFQHGRGSLMRYTLAKREARAH